MRTLRELCVSITMRLVAAGHTLCEAQELAALVVLQLVLLYTLWRHRVVVSDEIRCADRTVPCLGVPVPRSVHAVLPAAAGTVGFPALPAA